MLPFHYVKCTKCGKMIERYHNRKNASCFECKLKRKRNYHTLQKINKSI